LAAFQTDWKAKAARWRAAADPEAVAGYVPMFARHGLPNRHAPVAAPVLAITGERDTPPMRRAAVTDALSPLCADLEVVSFPDCGHYPMQETPPRLVAVLERFWARATDEQRID
jgi:pimeloyl-ACP methyl ester carboxylesterase